jgi:hypothetical protein
MKDACANVAASSSARHDRPGGDSSELLIPSPGRRRELSDHGNIQQRGGYDVHGNPAGVAKGVAIEMSLGRVNARMRRKHRAKIADFAPLRDERANAHVPGDERSKCASRILHGLDPCAGDPLLGGGSRHVCGYPPTRTQAPQPVWILMPIASVMSVGRRPSAPGQAGIASEGAVDRPCPGKPSIRIHLTRTQLDAQDQMRSLMR